MIGNSAAEVLLASRQPFDEDPEYIAAYFARHGKVPMGCSPFRTLQALVPGELIEIQGDSVQRERSPIAINSRANPTDDAEAIEQFKTLLDNSVRQCLPPHADTAVMLSGGLDSGPVALLADRHAKGAGRRLRPISWSLRDFPEADESVWTGQMARQLSESVIWLECSTMLPYSDLENTPVNPEAPGYNPFRALINQCYRSAAERGCDVILNGNAGDDLYHPYPLLYRGYWKHREWAFLLEDLSYSVRRGGLRMLRFKKPLRQLLTWPFAGWHKPRPPAWMTDHAVSQLREPEVWPPECAEHPFPAYAEQLYGPSMTQGRAIELHQSTAFGVERRDPFHNEELVEFMLNAPFSFSFRHHRSKWIMREAMKGMLPERLRLKRRTGVLNSFYLAGKVANRRAIYQLLFDRHREWQRWVKPAVVSSILEDGHDTGAKATLVDQCIGYVLWLNYWTTRTA